jgi:hypothetical protein
MKPVSVSVEVPQSREEIYEYLDVLGNHEPVVRRANARSLQRLAQTLAAKEKEE